MNINAQNFLEYFKENCPSNVNYIQSIKFNKKSITVRIDEEDKPFVFNDFFTERSLYALIISYLSSYIKENNLNCFNTVGVVYDRDYLKYTFKKLNIR